MKRVNEKTLSKHAEVDVYFEGVVATESNQRVMKLIEDLRFHLANEFMKQGVTSIEEFDAKQLASLSQFWHDLFQQYKAIENRTEEQRRILHDATIRCAVLDHVLLGEPIEIQAVRDLKIV